MEQRKKQFIGILCIVLFFLLPFSYGFFRALFLLDFYPSTNNLSQNMSMSGTLGNIEGYVLLLSYILFFAGLIILISVLRKMPKKVKDNPNPDVLIREMQKDIKKSAKEQKPQREKREHRGLWEALNSEIGEKRPVPVPQAPQQTPPVPVQAPKKEESKTTTCPGCLREYKHPGMNKKLRCTNCGYMWST